MLASRRAAAACSVLFATPPTPPTHSCPPRVPVPNAEPAPGPDNVNWEGLWAGWAERKRRTFYLLIPNILIMLFPIGALVGALTNLPLAVCGGSSDSK